MREEGRKIVLFSFVHERSRRVHELVQILDPVGAVSFGLVIGDEPAFLEHHLDRLGQGQTLRFRPERFDEAQERSHRCGAFPRKTRGGLVKARIAGLCRILQGFERARADSARRKIGHPQESPVVVRIGREPQIRERVLDFHALEEPQAPVHAVGDAVRKKRVLDDARLRVRAVQHPDIGKAQPRALQRLHFLGEPARFVPVALRLVDAYRLAVPGGGPQVLAEPLPVVGDERVGRREDEPVRAVVLLQADDVLDAEIALEFGHVADVRPAKPVNGLIVITDCEHDIFRPGEKLQPAVLEAIGVLEFVHQDVAETALVVLAEDLVPGKELEAAQQQLREIHHALALALLVVGGVDLGVTAGDFVADLEVAGAPALLLGRVDEVLRVPRRESFLVDAERL